MGLLVKMQMAQRLWSTVDASIKFVCKNAKIKKHTFHLYEFKAN